jgi:hypothetical protein
MEYNIVAPAAWNTVSVPDTLSIRGCIVRKKASTEQQIHMHTQTAVLAWMNVDWKIIRERSDGTSIKTFPL